MNSNSPAFQTNTSRYLPQEWFLVAATTGLGGRVGLSLLIVGLERAAMAPRQSPGVVRLFEATPESNDHAARTTIAHCAGLSWFNAVTICGRGQQKLKLGGAGSATRVGGPEAKPAKLPPELLPGEWARWAGLWSPSSAR